jgi:hypothetical protein
MKLFYQTGQTVEDGDLIKMQDVETIFNLLLVKIVDGKYFTNILCLNKLLELDKSPYFQPIKDDIAKLINVRLICRKNKLTILATAQMELLKERVSSDKFKTEPPKEIMNEWNKS